MQKPDALLHTKIRLPSTRPSLVPRPRLQEQIMAGLRDPLTLVIAPAGFGKTTLVASCIAGCGLPVAWLSLDKDDNQLERFLRYVIASLQEVDAGIGVTAAQLLTSSPSTSPRAILTSLINDLDSNSHEIALVLDDYQFISSPAVHEQLAFLLEHCPGTLRLVIATRSDPALPLARMRARGHTLELRGADLSFTEQEAAQFLNGAMGLCLDARSVAVLKQRTEGWIAGLQMAALSMRDRKDVPAFIEAFSGTNRYILDYLLEEVLAGQSPQVQRFLLYTSILERLSAPLCDALLAGAEELQDGYAPGTSGSTSTLDYLERANLFLVPLDDERTWYRYHQLFADLLRTQLQKLIGERAVAGLHRRTAEWHEKYGSVLDAIHHAALASDDEMSERLIEQSYLEMVSRGEMYGLRFWSNQLNRELVHRRPQLCIYEAYSHGWFGELDEADSLLEIAEKRLQAEPSLPGASAMLGHLTYVKSRLTALHGNLPRAIELNYKAREYLPVTNVALQLDLGITLGYL
jgi:LuxR family maltose regulon positive regulatory protein